MEEEKLIDRRKYKELSKISWSFYVDELKEEDALYLYERHWRLVNYYNMDSDEKKLIDYLAKKYRNGELWTM